MGNALKNRRDDFVLATKVGWKTGEGPNYQGSARKHIMQQVRKSLSRLQTHYIDLYICHQPDPETPLRETLQAMDDLVSQGTVNYIGCSNFTKAQLEEALETSRIHNLESFISIQPRYHLLDRTIESELLPFCREKRIAVTTYSPLFGGVLTGKYTSREVVPLGTRGADSPYLKERLTDANLAKVEGLRKIALEADLTLTQLALGWILSNPAVTSLILGVRNPNQLEENIKGLPKNLPKKVLEKLGQFA